MREKDYYGAIKGFCLKWNLPEVWNSDRITGANLIYEVVKVINAMVKELRDYEDRVDDKLEVMRLMIEEFLLMFDENLSDTVKEQLTVWLNDGTLGDIINETLFNSKLDKESDVYGHALSILEVEGDKKGLTDTSDKLMNALDQNNTVIFPKGTYLFTKGMTLNFLNNKRIIGLDDVIFKVKISDIETLFNLQSNVSFENIVFDFNNQGCNFALRYFDSVGKVFLKNLTFKNIKDNTNTTATNVVYISSNNNEIYIKDITFKNISKLGNNNITDGSGSLGCITYVGEINTLGGVIENIVADNVYNFNSTGNRFVEDTSVVYLANGFTNANVLIKNILGKDYGKRLIKVQAKNVEIDTIKTSNAYPDCLSPIAILSEGGLYSENVKIKNCDLKGVFNYGIAINGKNIEIKNVLIEPTNNSSITTTYGILSNDVDGFKLFNYEIINCDRPISLDFYENTENNSHIFENGYIRLARTSFGAIFLRGTFGLNNLKMFNTIIEDLETTTQRQPLIYGLKDKDNKNIHINNTKFLINRAITNSNSLVIMVENCENVLIENTLIESKNIFNSAETINIVDSNKVALRNISNNNYTSNRYLSIITSNDVSLMGIDYHNSKVTPLYLKTVTDVYLDDFMLSEQAKIQFTTNDDATQTNITYGTTLRRPLNKYVTNGYTYFDSTLNKLLIRKGTEWVDTSGVSA